MTSLSHPFGGTINKLMKQFTLENEFKQRYLGWLNKGEIKPTTNFVYAIPITKEELKEIKDCVITKTKWRGISYKYMLAVGEPTLPPTFILHEIPSMSVRLPNQTDEEKYVTAYYYPPQDLFIDRTNNIIPFEDVRVAWKFQLRKLTALKKFNDVLIIKFNEYGKV